MYVQQSGYFLCRPEDVIITSTDTVDTDDLDVKYYVQDDLGEPLLTSDDLYGTLEAHLDDMSTELGYEVTNSS